MQVVILLQKESFTRKPGEEGFIRGRILFNLWMIGGSKGSISAGGTIRRLILLLSGSILMAEPSPAQQYSG